MDQNETSGKALTLCGNCVRKAEKKHTLRWDGSAVQKGQCDGCGVASDRLWRYEVLPRPKGRPKKRVPDKHVCQGCAYSVYVGDWWACQYSSITEHSRPCPGGRHCTVRVDTPRTNDLSWRAVIHKDAQARQRKPTAPESRNRSPKWDYELACRLYDQGKGLDEIAQAVGANKQAVGSYMRQRGRPFAQRRKPRTLPWDTARAVELRRQGVSYDKIARTLGAARGSVYKYLVSRGIQPDPPKKETAPDA